MAAIAPRGVVPIPSDVDLRSESFSNQHVEVKERTKSRDVVSHSDDTSVAIFDPSTDLPSISETTNRNPIALIPKIQKKPSCLLTNVVSTCVNKASAHLELLQTLIEEWFDTPPDEYCAGHSSSKTASAKSSVRMSRPGINQGNLSVSGIGMKTPAKVVKHDIADELPYLGGMEVIEEVFALIARLEGERQTNERDLFQQKRTARKLQRHIENLAIKRARDFPIAVQAEHDAAVEDLNELHWHVTFKERTEEKLRERVNNSTTFNERINEDISHVQKHCPLVEEKLSLELDAMHKINMAQDETDRELELTLDRLAKTKVRNEEAHTKAGKERINMAREIEDVGQELQDALTELADARMLYNTYTHQMTDTRRQIQENVEEKKVLTVQCENARMAEKMQNKKIDDLTNKIRMIETEHHKLEEDAFSKQQELDVMTNTMESQYKELTLASAHEEDRLKSVTYECDNLVIEIDQLTSKIAKCETGIMEDEKSLRRMNSQIHNTEMIMNQMLDEFSRVQLLHSSIRDRLQEEKERISQIEDALRHTLETLKKQCKEEIHTRGVLKSRITSDGGELVKSEEQAKEQKVQLTKTVGDIEQQLKVVVEKVDKLRDVYTAKMEVLQGLEKEIKITLEARARIEAEFVETEAELNPHLQKLKEGSSDLRQQLKKLTNQMELMARKKDEMDHSARVLEKSIKQNELSVEKLKADLTEYSTQLEAQTALTNSLMSAKDDILRRTDQRQKEHTHLMSERSVTINKHAETMQKELAANRGLAETYRKLQGEYVDMKSKVMDMFDERNRLEAGIKDLKQLKGLQSRMRRALETYYKFRGLFNSGELARVEAENRISARKVTVLQQNYTKTVETITSFLHGQMIVLNDRKAVQQFQNAAV